MVYAIPKEGLATRMRHAEAQEGLTWDCAHDFLANIDVGLDCQGPGVHGAHALELLLAARVELLVHGRESVDEQLNVGLDLAGDVGDTFNLEAQTAVTGGKGNVEERS